MTQVLLVQGAPRKGAVVRRMVGFVEDRLAILGATLIIEGRAEWPRNSWLVAAVYSRSAARFVAWSFRARRAELA